MAEKDNLNDEENSLITEVPMIPTFKKRKRLSRSRLKEAKASLLAKQGQSTCLSNSYRKCKQKKNESTIERWSAERLAERSMWELMKAEGATFENPIPRPVLRTAARKHIGDTGLLDHLLKHIDGKVAPGGAERFRRWYNANGTMEYWLENADLANIRQEAGVHDPYWVPHSRPILKGGDFEETESAGELKLLRAEMAKMKRDMQELASKIRDQEQLNSMEIIHKELIKKEAVTEERLNEITGCLKGLQGILSGELMTWKTKVEVQLMEITSSLGCVQPSKQQLASPASERWEDWLESTNLVNFQEDELASWFEGNNIFSAQQDVIVQDFYPAPSFELKYGNNLTQNRGGREEKRELLLEELSKSKRDVMEKQEDDGANVTSDSSATGNSKSEPDTSVHMFQEMFQELFSWKAKMEQQVMELRNSVCKLEASSHSKYQRLG
ncbi:protein DYAD-like isoform X2 [Momordica charantia]|uniref:Protein DYAD-like isoform X2 n=1 Tax=Momordica charantia TaxID=3673 RepID=A0A6J1DXP5_MOMCH|nr:protein DYAD-like isoform X2 [Momordica charantia]XP_022159100.1 protein DYAD-like isoform X2 [Momordica charantia]